jgi:hypothetical protein
MKNFLQIKTKQSKKMLKNSYHGCELEGLNLTNCEISNYKQIHKRANIWVYIIMHLIINKQNKQTFG